MTFLKKVNENWNPVEFSGMSVGDINDFPGPYENLVRSGMAVLVDKDGNEIELPGQVFECPICFGSSQGLTAFVEHVSTHKPKIKEETVVEEKTEGKSKTVSEALYNKRLAALEKARAARKAKVEAKKNEEEKTE